ncbi:MAG: prolyl oligopeptidase family serine peptidase [Pirellulales bacterium]|nr:prolyl oligopeptidase family serine peptidase [Pirellulales bacterium]
MPNWNTFCQMTSRRNERAKWGIIMCLGCVVAYPARAGEFPIVAGSTYTAQDTLSCGEEPSEDAQQCLAALRWVPSQFTVRCDKPEEGCGNFLVRYPSPIDTRDPANDLVAMEWYVARDTEKNILRAPAIVIVHESGRNMTVGRMIARGLAGLKMHTFLIQLPGYGVRKTDAARDVANTFEILKQGVADVRRARDAVAALPSIDTTKIGLQGTSLGGFVTATVAGLDHGYNRIFILLAGGNLHEVIEQGARDSASLRDQLKAAGIEGTRLRELTRTIEPLRLAHRMDPQTTWLYYGEFDDVVPPACSQALAKAARLPDGHHIQLPVDHYSGIVLLPKILLEIYQAMTGPGD